MKRRSVVTAVCCLAVSLILSACGSSSGATPTATPVAKSGGSSGKFTAGLVTDIGGLNDKSFNHDAYLGLQDAEKAYGISGHVQESHAQTDYVPNLTTFAREHYGLTIAVGFLMESAIYQVARAYPKDKFAIIDGYPTDAKGNQKNLPNVANLLFREQESGYLVGAIAGLMEKDKIGKAIHNTIGYMGGLSIPPVNRYIAGYVAGARHVNPGIKILGGYSQSFESQSAGKSIGLAQIAQHADILFQVAGASGLGYLAAAQQRGVYGIGADADQGYLGAYVIASALKRVDVAVKDTIRTTMTGHFTGGDHRFDLAGGGTGFKIDSPIVPSRIAKQVDAIETKIVSGKIVPPTVIPR